ncbi:MAG: hypothetical protein E7513_01905 [Ruminococcaceae bacterium]|nr:hypothetical protein [Oscillospiraceae bacterium]
MKKCEYCAKEISYHQMYCNDECQNGANRFYDMRDMITSIMSVINGICVMSIGIGLFVFSFFKIVGAYMVAIPLLILGILYIFFPVPADVMIQKYKIEKSVKITRYIGIALLILGVLCTVLAIFTI